MTTDRDSGAGPDKNERKDEWAELASLYFKVTNGPTVPPIENMLRLLNDRWPLSKATSILDTGCGPGPVISKLIGDFGSQIPASATLRAADFSPAMVEQVQKTKDQNIAEGNQLWKRVQTEVQDAQELKGIEDGSVSHVTGGFVYFLVPDPRKALDATWRVLSNKGDGGVLALSTWKGSEWIDLMGVLAKLKPDTDIFPFSKSWMSIQGVKGELEAAGFKDVEAEEVHTEMEFEDHEQIVRFFIEKLPNMKTHTQDMSKEEVQELQRLMVDELKRMHPVAPSKMTGTAIVAVARKDAKARL